MKTHEYFLKQAYLLAEKNIKSAKGGPFGAVVVKKGKIIGKGANQVTTKNDPTAHAEIIAIRSACKHLKSHQLTNCIIYTTCEPCPMCLSAIYWARPKKVYYACTTKEASSYHFDDSFIYKELALPIEKRKMPLIRIGLPFVKNLFKLWKSSKKKILY